MKVVYKCKNTGIVSDSINLNEFVGYRIQIDHNKISKITEFCKDSVLATISYRPTKTTLIEKVEYNGHVQYRYNNNNVSTLCYEYDNKLFGEYVRFDPYGQLITRLYYYNNVDITNDIINFIEYKGDVSDFKYYEFKDYERFNLMIKYGFHFRFCFEWEMNSTDFDAITAYCSNI